MENLSFFIAHIDKCEKPRLKILKSKRILEVYDGGKLVARMRVALGAGTGPKLREGDGRTPEGLYYTCVRNEKSKFHLSIGISYPNVDDARHGLETGLIDNKQFEEIVSASANRIRPPWNTGLGGEIMIHGGGADRDWTAGCIALDNDAMNFLFQFIENGTKVEIAP
jgi:murein L,D-transpeptidase YafK